jgi:hypothetical protein
LVFDISGFQNFSGQNARVVYPKRSFWRNTSKTSSVVACFQSAKTVISLPRRAHVQKWHCRLRETLILGVTTAVSSKRRSRLDCVHILHVHDLRFSS